MLDDELEQLLRDRQRHEIHLRVLYVAVAAIGVVLVVMLGLALAGVL